MSLRTMSGQKRHDTRRASLKRVAAWPIGSDASSKPIIAIQCCVADTVNTLPPAYRLTADFGRLAAVPIVPTGRSFCSEDGVMLKLTDYVKTARRRRSWAFPRIRCGSGPRMGRSRCAEIRPTDTACSNDRTWKRFCGKPTSRFRRPERDRSRKLPDTAES